MKSAESTRDTIRRLIEQRGSVTGPELAEGLGISRQAVSLHLRSLIAEGVVFKTGSTRAARYLPGDAAPVARNIRRKLKIKGLEESSVYDKVALALNLSTIPDNVEAIVHYAFTEMLNNVIDHSASPDCTIDVAVDARRVGFEVRDFGIGVFHSIASKFGLADEQDALVELVKGKTTTMPEAHTGEGIFFVSRAADRFVLRSHRLQLEWNRKLDDVFVSDTRFLKGTFVQFEIATDSRTRLENVFGEFAPEEYDFQFEKTRVLVKLLRASYVSRSEAKRLMHNLDNFSEVELDMRDVRNIGQGFADEIFRVFRTANPHTKVRAINATPGVAAMLSHVAGEVE
jgi:biotin operon repressor/anti-sigma regulatory factor (Ser/Thr protein kinase)